MGERSSFREAIGSFPKEESPVRVYDPTNNENNAASRITTDQRAAIVKAASHAAEELNRATLRREKGDTLGVWRRIMGPGFRIEE